MDNKIKSKEQFVLNNRCLSHPTIAMNNQLEFFNGSSKKAHFYIKKTDSEKYLEKQRASGCVESFFASKISFNGEFKKFFWGQFK
jgi:hypothetical protein